MIPMFMNDGFESSPRVRRGNVTVSDVASAVRVALRHEVTLLEVGTQLADYDLWWTRGLGRCADGSPVTRDQRLRRICTPGVAMVRRTMSAARAGRRIGIGDVCYRRRRFRREANWSAASLNACGIAV
jgi:hypothetical protein